MTHAGIHPRFVPRQHAPSAPPAPNIFVNGKEIQSNTGNTVTVTWRISLREKNKNNEGKQERRQVSRHRLHQCKVLPHMQSLSWLGHHGACFNKRLQYINARQDRERLTLCYLTLIIMKKNKNRKGKQSWKTWCQPHRGRQPRGAMPLGKTTDMWMQRRKTLRPICKHPQGG